MSKSEKKKSKNHHEKIIIKFDSGTVHVIGLYELKVSKLSSASNEYF